MPLSSNYIIISLFLVCWTLPALAAPKNADSAFAKDTLQNLDEREQAYYTKFFLWTIEYAPAGKPQAWKSYDSHGEITPDAFFKSGRGMQCRKFSERYTVGRNAEQARTGLACKAKKGGWCKLRATSEPSCELMRPDGIDGYLLDLDQSMGGASMSIQRLKNWWNN